MKKRAAFVACLIAALSLTAALLYLALTPLNLLFHVPRSPDAIQAEIALVGLDGEPEGNSGFTYISVEAGALWSLISQGLYLRPVLRPADAAFADAHMPMWWIRITVEGETRTLCLGRDSSCVYLLESGAWFRVTGPLTGDALYSELSQLAGSSADP